MTRELLARCRTILSQACDRHDVTVWSRLPGSNGLGGQRTTVLALSADRDTVEDLVRQIDQALTGVERDHLFDRVAATHVACALSEQGRIDLLVDLLAQDVP